MEHPDPLSRTRTLAPILAFTEEHNMGGKTTSAQLNYLIKLLKRSDDENPLVDFYANCDIPFPKILLKTLPSRSILIRGLEFLLATFKVGWLM